MSEYVKGSVVSFWDDTGKQKAGQFIRQIRRGRLKGWFRIRTSVHGKNKIVTVDEIEKTLTTDRKKLTLNKPEGG